MKRTHFVGTSVAALGALALPRVALAQSLTNIRIATLPIDGGSAVFYAQDQGYFRDAGLTADIQVISNGGAIAAAVASGTVDIGFSNLVSVVQAIKHGVAVKVVAPGSLDLAEAPTTLLVTSKDSTAKSAADLTGKTIATNGLANILQFAAQAWIDKNGGQSSTVHFVEMPFPTMITALSTNRVDAAVVVEPFVAEAKNVGHTLAAVDSAIAPRLLIGCWIASDAWATANAATVSRFAQAMGKAATWANSHHKESGVILARHTDLKDATISSMQRAAFPTRIVNDEIQPVVDLTAKYGNIGPTFPAAQIIFKTDS
jgi:NitT/TauT family transport system substrate-binding protein